MNPLSITTIIFSLAFFIAYILRRKKIGVAYEAEIVTINEGIIDTPNLYTTLRYYYPIIVYEYHIEQKVITGKVDKKDSRIFRVPEFDSYGSKSEPSCFFWRELSIGDKINIYYSTTDLEKSWLSKDGTSVYKSESIALLVISALFLLLSIVTIVYFKNN